MEKTLVIIKPDAVTKKNIGKIISVYENDGLNILKIKSIMASRNLLEIHYEEHKKKSFYPSLIDFMSSSISVFMLIEGNNAIRRVRKLNGKTNPSEADKNSIRGMFGIDTQKNAVHGSASENDAEREIEIWFGEKYDT